MDGLDIDNDSDFGPEEHNGKVVKVQEERIRYLEGIEQQYKRLQSEYERLKAESQTSHAFMDHNNVETISNELRNTRELVKEKDHRLQYLEDANNRFLFRMRNLQVEISSKENEILELNNEIMFIKRKMDKSKEILINEIKQKDIIIDNYKRKQRQYKSSSIPIDENEVERASASSIGSISSSYANAHVNSYGYHPQRRMIRQNRVSVQDETDIINEWNHMIQIFTESNDASFISRLKQYVLLSTSRLGMLAKDTEMQDEGIYSEECYLCSCRFGCFCRPIVCSFCGYMFCWKCAPRCIPLGAKNEMKHLCSVCEAMYRFVYKKED